MKVAITVEGMFGLTWERWKRLAREIQALGFAGIFRSDHFTLPIPPDVDSLETIVSLAYLADHSQDIHFGTLVAPLSFRDPVMLARQAMALDDLSGGRMILGVGAGWIEREHTMFGYHLGDVKTRLDRLEEGLEVITRLIREDEPVTFTGRFFQLQEAHLLPRPARATPVMVGGNGPKRTLPLVARYADIWNCQVAQVELFQERNALLDDLLRQEGRDPGEVQRTVMVPAICWLDRQERDRRLERLRATHPFFSAMAADEVVGWLQNNMAGILGTPDQVGERLLAYADAGVEEMMLQLFDLDDIEGIEVLGEHVLPHVTTH